VEGGGKEGMGWGYMGKGGAVGGHGLVGKEVG